MNKIVLIGLIGVVVLISFLSLGAYGGLVVGGNSLIHSSNTETVYGRVTIEGDVIGDNIKIPPPEFQKFPYIKQASWFGGDSNIICSIGYDGKYYNKRTIGTLNAWDEEVYYFDVTKPIGQPVEVTIICEGDKYSAKRGVTIP